MMLPTQPYFGGKRDAADDRDCAFSPALAPETLPARVDLRPYCGPVYDQLKLRSCSANAVSALLTFLGNVEKSPLEPPSRLFIYYNERRIEGTLPADGGASIRTAFKTVVKEGICPEAQWPYDPAMVSTQPPEPCYQAATGALRPFRYFRVAPDLDHLRGCLAEGHAFVFGMQAYMQGFIQGQTSPHLSMPAPGDTLVGGHAVMAVGYDDTAREMLVMNSIGTHWGDNGFFWLPYDYVTSSTLAYDFWTIRSIRLA